MVRAGRHLWMTGSISVKGTLIDKYAFQKKIPTSHFRISRRALGAAFAGFARSSGHPFAARLGPTGLTVAITRVATLGAEALSS